MNSVAVICQNGIMINVYHQTVSYTIDEVLCVKIYDTPGIFHKTNFSQRKWLVTHIEYHISNDIHFISLTTWN